MTRQKWIRLSMSRLQSVGPARYPLDTSTVRRWCRHGYRLKSNRKRFRAAAPDRDRHSPLIAAEKRFFTAAGR